MTDFLVVALLISFTAMIIGLFKPSVVIRWGNETGKTRGKVLLYYGIATVLFFALVGAYAPKTKTVRNEPIAADRPLKDNKTTKVSRANEPQKPKEPKEKTIRWNTSELDANQNRNMYIAADLLNGTVDEELKKQAITASSKEVFDNPKEYYGKVVKFKAYIGKVFTYPKGSEESKVIGGGKEASQVYLITDDDTVYLLAIVIGSLKGHKKEELIELYGMPVGRTNVEAMGQEFLTVVAKM